jgi:hypothetical protein
MWWTRGERRRRRGQRPRRPCPKTLPAAHTRGTPGGRGDEHAPGSVAVGAPGSISAPTRRADSAGASSMIKSDSIFARAV